MPTVDHYAALHEEAVGILALYTAIPQEREKLRAGLPTHLRQWFERAYVDQDQACLAWLERHPGMALPLVEAYVMIRPAYPTQAFSLVRQRFNSGEIEEIVEEHIDDDEYDQTAWPDVVVEGEWTLGNYIEGDEDSYNPAALLVAQEDARLAAVFATADEGDASGRVERWWRGAQIDPSDKVVKVYTPYCMQDGVEGGMYSDKQLAEMAEEERAELAETPSLLAQAEDAEEREYLTYKLEVSRTFLAAIEAEQAYRARTGYAVEDYTIPLTEVESNLLDRYMDAYWKHETSEQKVEFADGGGVVGPPSPPLTEEQAREAALVDQYRDEWQQAKRARIERLQVRNRAKRDMRAALAQTTKATA